MGKPSIIYLLFTALICSSAYGCLSGHQHEIDASHIETQLKLLRARNQNTPPTGKTALTNVRVFDGWQIREPSTVVIDGDSITFDPRDVQNTIDGEGGVLLPGLIDSHIHITSLASLETLSSYGITTAMNMGCSNYTLCSALRDQVGLTSFFTAGEGAVAPNSTHAKVFQSRGYVYSPSQAPQFVANVFGNGSEYLKIISEADGFNQAIHDALVSSAHKLGKVTMTHAQDYDSYEVAIRSKTDGLQHVPFDTPLTEEMAQRIKRQAQYVTPTLNIGKIATSNSAIEKIVSGGIDLTYEAGVTSIQRLMRAGVPLLAGTDAIDLTESFLKDDLIGITLHRELQYLTEAGMSEVEALRAATVVPSIWHNLIGRGSIREGYRADLLLLKPGSDPLRNISKTMDIARVWNAGIEYIRCIALIRRHLTHVTKPLHSLAIVNVPQLPGRTLLPKCPVSLLARGNGPIDLNPELGATHAIRRVKCDEAIPSCYPCISTGRKCDGYGQNIEAPLDYASALAGALSPSLSVGCLGTEKERGSFYLFQQETAPQLSRFFGDDFWERLLLQAALHEPAIRHAIMALGSLHVKSKQDNNLVGQGQTNGWTDDFASKNYSQAINTLLESSSREGQQAIDVYLICSILFACLETMLSRYGSAITHVQSGIKILCEVNYIKETRRHQHNALKVSKLPYIPIDMLQEMFVRLDFQVSQMVPGQKWGVKEPTANYANEIEIPGIFSSLSETREILVSHWHVASDSTSDVWDPMSEKLPAIPPATAWQKKSFGILARWSSAYDAYLNIQGENLTDRKRKGTAVLRILKELGTTAMILTKAAVYNDEMKWDVFCPMFQKIVSLADDIVEADQKPTAGRPAFCMDMALIRPLFAVSCRCRDPIIRRRAISVLQNYDRTEGGWNSFATYKAAQRVMDIEEAGLQDLRSCDDVQEWARISNVSLVFHLTERRATLAYSGPRDEYDQTRQMAEVIEW
ncbi:hypothetical protein V490_00366 [Pseudogymnoascus sp. VKM F-3557]|nr:hypothetical protein V490_00366 [Pseudogymnoascus sp. VKM F-3557]